MELSSGFGYAADSAAFGHNRRKQYGELPGWEDMPSAVFFGDEFPVSGESRFT